MRNPLIFWGVLSLLQLLWAFIGLGTHHYAKLIHPNVGKTWWWVVAAVVVGDVLMCAFNYWLPSLRWRGTMGLLLFSHYAALFTLFWLAYYHLSRWLFSSSWTQQSIIYGMPLLWLCLIGAGLYYAYTPRTVYHEVSVNKPMSRPIKIALVSDTHLGTFIGKHHLQALQEIIAREQADILLLAGDVMDDLPDQYRHLNMHPHMQSLSAPLGKYVVLGNHDNYRKVQGDIVSDLQDAGFTVLRDESVVVHEQLLLVGRRDHVEQRLSADALLSAHSLPVVVMDHQPVGPQIQALADHGADLIVSGHTHAGQIFPLTALIGQFQTYPYGHYQIDDAHLVVTSGLGLWGLPFRLGTQSEVAIVTLSSQHKCSAPC